MLNVPAILTGAVGAALLAASFVPSLGSDASFAAAAGSPAPTVIRSAKSDRLGVPLPSATRATISVVQQVGVSRTAPQPLRGDDDILFGPAPLAKSPAFFISTPQPVVVIGKRQQRPAFREPGNREEGMDGAQKRPPAVGCLASVSPLAQAAADQPPGLCLARLSPSGPATGTAVAARPA